MNQKLFLFLSLTISFIFFNNSCNDMNIDHLPDYAFEARPEFIPGNEVGVLVIHGFTGSPQSMREVAHKLHEKGGYTVSLPLLSGHGRTPLVLEQTTYHDWIQSVNEAYNILRGKVKKVFILGLSMGGTQTLHCAANYPIDGAIIINASVSTNPDISLPDYSRLPRFSQGIGSDIKKTGIREWAYSQVPAKGVETMAEFRVVVSKELSKITAPILVFKSLEDHVVRPEVSDYIFDNVSSENKTLINLENSYHVATLDYDQGVIIQKSYEFIQENMK